MKPTNQQVGRWKLPIVPLAVACLVAAGAMLIRPRAIRIARSPTNDEALVASIAPTLAAGDWVVLTKSSEPQFGDLVFCPDPAVPRRALIGRVFGSKNDVVAVEGANVIVNHQVTNIVDDCGKFAIVAPDTKQRVAQNCVVERLDQLEHPRGESESSHGDYARPMTVLPNRIYLVSDNRDFPLDSRSFGALLREDCPERIVARLWPWRHPFSL